jgi:hypothetical protein
MSSPERTWDLDEDSASPFVQLWLAHHDHLGRPGFVPVVGRIARATMFALHVRTRSTPAAAFGRHCPAIAVVGVESECPVSVLVQPSQRDLAMPRELVLAFIPDEANPDVLENYHGWLTSLE